MAVGGKQVGMRSIHWTLRCYDCAALMDVFASDEGIGTRGRLAPHRRRVPERPSASRRALVPERRVPPVRREDRGGRGWGDDDVGVGALAFEHPLPE